MSRSGSWEELAAAAPELAARGRERLEATGVAMLGTIRADGSPRISPVEPHLHGGELLFAAMRWSAKAHDLRRDPRCVLHTAVVGPDAGEDELKLYGRAALAADRGTEGWWTERPPGAADVYRLEIEQAVLVSWETEAGTMTVGAWSADGGYRERRRSYP